MHRLPNILTTFRIFIIPIMILTFYIPGPFANILCASLFAIASITDYFDGYFARSLNAESNFGRCLDPIADKLVVAVAIILIISFGNQHPMVMIPGLIIVCREILVSGLREFLAEFKVKLPVSRLAKYKTALQMTSITILLAGANGFAHIIKILKISSDEEYIFLISGHIIHFGVFLLIVASTITAITGYQYFKAGMKKC